MTGPSITVLESRAHRLLLPGAAWICLLLSACASPETPGFTEEDQRRHQEYWKSYTSDDPDWPRIRQEWLAEGPRSGSVLIQSVLREFVTAFDRSDLARYERARRELVALAPDSVPFLVEALIPAEDVVRKQLTDVLVLLGEPAVDPLQAKLRSGDAEVRRTVIVILGGIRSAAARQSLAALLRTEPEWKVRAEIPMALVRTDPGAAIGPLTRTLLEDPDSFVRRKAASALATLGEDVAGGPLVAALRKASGRRAALPEASSLESEEEWIGLEKEIRHLCQTLDRLTRKGYGNDVQRWVSWWERRG